MASFKAFNDEILAFDKLKKIIPGSVFQAPAGADAGFPDYGFTITLDDGSKVDAHIEFKNSHTAQMGSMRDWKFDGRKFYTPDTNSEQKSELIALMNGTRSAIVNGDRLLKDLQVHFSKDVKELNSGSLTVIKDKQQRYISTLNFANNTRDYQIANIADAGLGQRIITHYKNKFAKSRVPGRANKHILMMQIKDEIWYLDTHGSVDQKVLSEVSTKMGATRTMNKLAGLTAQLEVRIQPRGLQSKGSKPTSIDVMASYRLKGKPANGVSV